MSVVYFNHELVAKEEGVVTGNAFSYGDGAFTTLRLFNGRVFFLKQHLKRVVRHARFLGLDIPKIPIEAFYKLVQVNQAFEGLWRFKILIASKESELDLSKERKSDLIITLQKESTEQNSAVRLCSFPTPVTYPLARIKSISFLSRLFIKKFAKKKNFDECIVFGENGYVLETALANLFWIKGGVFYFPSPKLYYFRGVTLQAAILSAREIGLRIKQGTFVLSDLKYANVFICSSMRGIVSVSEIENLIIQSNPKLEKALQRNYEKMAQENSLKLSNRALSYPF